MRLELVAIPAGTTSLDGLFYEPEGGANAGAVLLFHGNAMNFYSGAMRFLPPVLTQLGQACLAFNRRGHDILSTRNSRIAEGSAYQSARKGIEELTAQARTMVAEDRGRELMLMPGWWYAISAESFLDRLTETPAVLELAPKIRCPSLLIRGDKEPREQYPAEEFRRRSGGPCTVEIVANCDHF